MSPRKIPEDQLHAMAQSVLSELRPACQKVAEVLQETSLVISGGDDSELVASYGASLNMAVALLYEETFKIEPRLMRLIPPMLSDHMAAPPNHLRRVIERLRDRGGRL